jgi:hypothetical protein
MEELSYAQAAFGTSIRSIAQRDDRMYYPGLFSRSHSTNQGITIYVGKFAPLVRRVGARVVA